MRRIILLPMVGVVVAAMMALSGGVALADSVTQCTKNVDGPGTLTCVTTTVTETTEFVVNEATEFVETQATEFVVNEATEFVERPTTGPCEVGNSGRVGIAEGIATDEILVTTTTIVTKVFKGGEPNPNKLLSTNTVTEVERELVDTIVERELVGTVVERELVDTVVEREVVNTTFTPTSKCRNIPGPQ